MAAVSGRLRSSAFHCSNAVMQSVAGARFLGQSGGPLNRGARVSREDCGDEGTGGGNRWGIACETESSH
jgi:hypothetical protein